MAQDMECVESISKGPVNVQYYNNAGMRWADHEWVAIPSNSNVLCLQVLQRIRMLCYDGHAANAMARQQSDNQ